MSYFDDASLVMIPSGYKDQKVYSVKPIDGSGDLTFSRASNATRVNSSGLVEKVRTNLALYSEQFDNATWNKGSLSVSANTIANPVNGATTADTIVEAATTGTHYLYQSPSLTGSFTYSVYAKAKERDHIVIAGSINTTNFYSALFDLTSGSVQQTANGSSTGLTASIVSVGSGWYRCSVALSSSITIPFVIWTSDGSTLSPTYYEPNYAGDGTSGVYIFGAQAETGDIATDYIATTTSAVSVGPVSGLPRLDYSGGASCPSLLLEPQRTNAQTFSEDLTQLSAWGLGAITISANAITSPDGYQNADKVVESATTARHELYSQYLSFSGTSSVSFYAKAGERRYLSCFVGGDPSVGGVTFDLQTGTAPLTSGGTSAKIEAVSGATGWYRCSFTTTKVANTQAYFCLRQTLGASPDVETYAGDGTSGLYLWGLQTELAATYATSYIPTLSSAVTRVADAASKTGISSLIGQTEGTVYIEMSPIGGTTSYTERILKITGGTDEIGIYRYGNDILYVSGLSGGVVSFELQKNSVIYTGQTYKIAIGYKLNDVAAYLNGVQIGTDTSAAMFTSLANMQFANDTSAGFLAPQNVKQTLLFKTRLSNADLATLTTL